VTGAGDVVLSVFGMFSIAGLGFSSAATIANLAASIEVTRIGTEVITRADLARALSPAHLSYERKIHSIDELKAALERERRGFGSVKGEIRLLCNHLQAEVRTAADERFHAYHGEATRRVTANLREAMAGWKGHLGRMTREFEEWLADVMMEEMGAVSLHGEGHLAGFLFRAQASVERSVRAFVDRLGREIENALGIRFEGARFDPQVEEPAHPDVRLSPTFDTYFELLWFLIPMPVFRPLVRRHFLRRIPWEVEKNLSRVAGQWADAGNRGEEIRAALAELANLESAVS